MSSQLDILALEPYYGGVRRVMLNSLMRCSRHRWTLLKLPPRRMERRLSAAAHWFGELLTRHYVGSFDMLFTSEAMNLADLFRIVPDLNKKPSVVYFHSNQLPDGSRMDTPLDLVNLNTAVAASEVWFNSLYHLRIFLARASAMVSRHPELAGRNPMADLTAKAQILFPPLDLNSISEQRATPPSLNRERRSVLIDSADANVGVLNHALATLQRRGEKYRLMTIGEIDGLSDDLPRTVIPERDETAHIRAMLETNVYVSSKIGAHVDHQAVRALSAGCWPLAPQQGVYREMLPEMLHASCLYNGTADALTHRLQDVWHIERASGYEEELAESLERFDPVVACREMDDRLEQVMVGNAIRGSL